MSTTRSTKSVYQRWQRSGTFSEASTDELINEAAQHRDDSLFQHFVSGILATRGEYAEAAKLHVLYMKDGRYEGASLECEAMQEDMQDDLGITVNLKQLIESDENKAAQYVSQIFKLQAESESPHPSQAADECERLC